MKQKVYTYLKTVPPGRVTTYGWIAQHLGNVKLARAVGCILHNNPEPATIPCHRVVNARGRVAEKYAFGGAIAQRERLEWEGIVFSPDGSVDLAKYGYK